MPDHRPTIKLRHDDTLQYHHNGETLLLLTEATHSTPTYDTAREKNANVTPPGTHKRRTRLGKQAADPVRSWRNIMGFGLESELQLGSAYTRCLKPSSGALHPLGIPGRGKRSRVDTTFSTCGCLVIAPTSVLLNLPPRQDKI